MVRCKRATPLQLVRFLTSSKVIKITRNKEPPDLYNSLMSTLYSEPREPDIGYFFDNSKRKPGKQFLKNNLKLMKEINTPWLNWILTDDKICIEMTKVIFSADDPFLNLVSCPIFVFKTLLIMDGNHFIFQWQPEDKLRGFITYLHNHFYVLYL